MQKKVQVLVLDREYILVFLWQLWPAKAALKGCTNCSALVYIQVLATNSCEEGISCSANSFSSNRSALTRICDDPPRLDATADCPANSLLQLCTNFRSQLPVCVACVLSGRHSLRRSSHVHHDVRNLQVCDLQEMRSIKYCSGALSTTATNWNSQRCLT